MKLYIKGLILSGLLAGTACTDLDTDLNTKYTEFPENPIAVEGEFNGCYRYLHGWFGRDFAEGVIFQGDEVMGCCRSLGSYWDDGRYCEASYHSLHLDNWRVNACMEAAMSGITYTNEKIATYGGPTFDDPVVAPLRAIRAYYHFWMMELYGDTPLMDHVMEPGELIDRAPRADVARYIESELLAILNQEGGLSKANDISTYGKPNYWMAAALLVKLYLNWGVYTHDITTVTGTTENEKLNDCVYWCDQIIQSGLFEVGTGYRKKFYPDNGLHIKDFIYALDVDPNGKTDGTTSWMRWFDYKDDAMCLPNLMGFKPTQSLAGQTVLTKECVDRFNLPGDERNDMILVGPQYAFDAQYNKTDEPVIVYKELGNKNKSHIQLNFRAEFDFEDPEHYGLGSPDEPALNKANVENGTALLNGMKGARCFKYPAREEDYSLWGRQQANDSPIFRFADILLTKAECIMRGAQATNGDTPMSLFNEIRRCSNAPLIGANPTMDELCDERSREFLLEPWRRNDLIRFGKFEDDWGQKNRYKVWDNEEHTQFHWVDRPGVKDPRRRLMPIGRTVLNTNTNWSQTPGYAGI